MKIFGVLDLFNYSPHKCVLLSNYFSVIVFTQDTQMKVDPNNPRDSFESHAEKIRQYSSGIPYHKIDRSMFEAILEYLSQKGDEEIISSTL